jgi:hypothetical protein
MFSEGKIYSSMGGPASSLSTNLPSSSTFSSNPNAIGGMMGAGAQGMMVRIGYTPEQHVSKPRNISSNEVR